MSFRAGDMTPLTDLSGLEILLTNTRVGRNTRQLVAAVRARKDNLPKVRKIRMMRIMIKTCKSLHN